MNCRHTTFVSDATPTQPSPVRSPDRARRRRSRGRWLIAVAIAVGLLASGCTGGGDEDQSDPVDQPELDEAELNADGVVVIDDCAADTNDDDRLCVGVVSGMATAADIGIQDSARDAVAQWGEDNEATVVGLTADSEDDLRANIDLLVERGYDVVVVPGKNSVSVLADAVAEYTETYFVGVDQLGLDEADNLGSLSFSNHEIGFLAGALAGLLTESGDVAQVLGSALVPPISDLRDGFANGVRYTNSRTDVDAFFHPGDPEAAFIDPAWGAATAAQALEAGADVIFATGGETGHGALVETASSDGTAFCIGVDFDKWDVVADAQPCLVNSVVKLVEDGLEEMLDAAADGEQVSGEFEGQVSYSDYHDRAEDVPSEIRDAAEGIAEQLRAGEISATSSR